MLTMVFRPLDSYVSRYFTNQKLKQILEYHMVFLGSSPFQAPAIYTLMSHLDFQSGVFYPRRGMLSLVDDLVDLGSGYDITYHTNANVQEIIVENGKATGVKVDGATVPADIVVSNADLHHTETELLSPEYQSFPKKYWQKRQPGPGAFVLSLGIRGTLPQLQHHTLFFVDEWRANFQAIYEDMTIPEHASMYICNPTKTDPSLAPKDTENIMILVPLPSGVSMDASETQKFADRIISQLANVIDEKDLPSRIVSQMAFGPNDFADRYNAWEYNAFGGQSHILRQSVIFRTPNKSRKVKNLYYVGAGTLPGIGLPMCLMSAELVYKRIMGIKTGGALVDLEDSRS
jgi:phytoene desaturase